jgi:DnaJ-class molecular chaperone
MMIKFEDLVKIPTPTYKAICVACEGRAVVPKEGKIVRCQKCNGTGEEINTPEPADEE